jgi:hypothetical protein
VFKYELNTETGVFEMSTDWCRYSTPAEAQDRARNPLDNAIISMPVGGVRGVPGQDVIHAPIPLNRSHSNALSDEKVDPEIQLKLTRLCQLIIALT